MKTLSILMLLLSLSACAHHRTKELVAITDNSPTIEEAPKPKKESKWKNALHAFGAGLKAVGDAKLKDSPPSNSSPSRCTSFVSGNMVTTNCY